MDLRSTQLKDTYGNLVTIGSVEGAPTTGTLQNGQGTALTSVDVGGTITSDGLTVSEGSSGATANTNADAIVIENNDKTGLSILTPNTSEGLIFFGDPEDDNIGRIVYNHSNNEMSFVTNNNTRLVVDSSGNVGIGETNPSAKLEITGTDTEPLTVLNNTVYTFAANVATSQSNTHTVTIPFTSQASNHSNFLVEIYASLNWGSGASTTFAGRALYTLNTFTSVSNVAELEDVNNGNLSFSATSSGMDFVVTITTTATGGQEPDRIGVMAKVIRGNGLVGNEPISMTIA